MIAILALFAASVAATPLKIGDVLPEVKGEYLSGKPAALPDDAKGKVTLVAFGFSHDSQYAVEGWVKRFRGAYGKKENVTFFEVPMISTLGKMAKPFINGGMRKGTPQADYDHVMTVYGQVEPWKQRLSYREATDAYVMLLDGEGKILWMTGGAMDEALFEGLAAVMRKQGL